MTNSRSRTLRPTFSRIGVAITSTLFIAGCAAPAPTPPASSAPVISSAPSESPKTPVAAPAPQTPLETWALLQSALKAGDIDLAASLFVARRQDSYRSMFKQVGAEKSYQMVANLHDLKPWMEGSDIAGFSATAKTPMGELSFPVNFEKEAGVWKILEF